MIRHRRLWSVLTAFSLLGAGTAAAHDFFLKPAGFRVEPGAALSVDASVSGAFPELLNPVAPDRLRDVRVTGGGARATLEAAGVGSRSLRLRFHGHEPGWAVLAARTAPRDVEYPEDRIGGIMEEYEVSPEAVRAVSGLPRPRVLKVVSSRFAKSLVCVGRCDVPGESVRPVGHELEFVAVQGSPAAFRLLSKGEALGDYPVAVVGADGVRRRARTTAQGVLTLPADVTGPIMLFASVMQPPASPDARFELKLASLTVGGR